MISPTGYGIRGQDDWGSGAYGASRGKRKHNGVDFVCTPGQNIWFPFDEGLIIRIARPYIKGGYSGCVIEATEGNNNYTCKMFYFEPMESQIDRRVFIRKGEVIGTAQDISAKYPGITCHIHLQIANSRDKKWFNWFNPNDILEVPYEH